MVDIAPSLYERVNEKFKELIKANKKIQEINKKIRKKTADFEDANIYAVEVGDALARAFREIKADDLPDGKMYYNIADRVVRPNMDEEFEIVSEMADDIQQISLAAVGLGLKPIKPGIDKNRVQGIIDRVSDGEFGVVSWLLEEPIRNFAQNVVDESIKQNAAIQERLGLEAKIVRKAEPGGVRAVKRGNKMYQYVVPCRWCRALAGTYDYGEVGSGSDIWRRHENCRCIITYQSGRHVENVYTKKTYNSVAEAERDARIQNAKNYERRKDPTKLADQAKNYKFEPARTKRKQELREAGYERTRRKAMETPKATLIREMAEHAEKIEQWENKLSNPTNSIPDYWEKNPRKRAAVDTRWARELRYAREDLKIKYEVFEELYG